VLPGRQDSPPDHRMTGKRDAMTPLSRRLLVIAGYVLALMVAGAAVAIHAAITDDPDSQASSGMRAFGDSILLLAVFGLGAIPPSAAALFWLRPCPSFWRAASVVALAIAATGITALIAHLLPQGADAGSVAGTWSVWSPLRVLLAPLFAITFLLAGLLAPARSYRSALLGATAIETAVFFWGVLTWIQPFR